MHRVSFLIPLLPLVLVTPAHAAEIVVDGQDACLAIGGDWASGETCVVHRLVVPQGTTLVIAAGVGLASDGPIRNYGVLDTRGWFRPDGPTLNRGTLITRGITVNGDELTNEGTFLNYGWLHPHSRIASYGVFENEGYFETCTGQFENYGYMRNGNAIENWGGLIVNHAIAVNDGYIYNPSDWYEIANYGGFENNGEVINHGVLPVGCGGAWYGTGTFSGNPVEYEPCDPALAIEQLNADIFELGPQQEDFLTKAQVVSLTSKTARAGKRPGESAALVEAFVEEVGELVADGVLPRHIGASLIGRVDRIAVLLAGGA